MLAWPCQAVRPHLQTALRIALLAAGERICLTHDSFLPPLQLLHLCSHHNTPFQSPPLSLPNPTLHAALLTPPSVPCLCVCLLPSSGPQTSLWPAGGSWCPCTMRWGWRRTACCCACPPRGQPSRLASSWRRRALPATWCLCTGGQGRQARSWWRRGALLAKWHLCTGGQGRAGKAMVGLVGEGSRVLISQGGDGQGMLGRQHLGSPKFGRLS